MFSHHFIGGLGVLVVLGTHAATDLPMTNAVSALSPQGLAGIGEGEERLVEMSSEFCLWAEETREVLFLSHSLDHSFSLCVSIFCVVLRTCT